jgi:hypothetical protein
MISLIFMFFEGFFNSVMDTLDHHYSTSIFKDWNPYFWNPALSWKQKYELPDWIPDTFTDSWHIAKFLQIISFLIAIVFYAPITGFFGIGTLNTAVDFLCLGILRNLTFNLFYNYILVVK